MSDRGAPTQPSQPIRLRRAVPRNLSDEVYGILREGILAQEIAPGTRLLESELGMQLGVSRAPVREALRRLEQEGLVESFPRRGTTVARVPDDEIDLFYGLRAEIEAEAFRRACSRISDQDLAELDEIHEKLQRAYAAADVDAVLDADMRFHGKVMEVSGLTLLRRVWSSFDGPLRLRAYQLIEADPEPEKAIIESREFPHRRLLEALVERDAASAAHVVRQHILEVSTLYRTASHTDR